MKNDVSSYELVFELSRSGLKPEEIAARVGKDRATIYRWLRGIRYRGLRRFVKEKQEAKRHRKRRTKTEDRYRKQLNQEKWSKRILSISVIFLLTLRLISTPERRQ